MPRAQTQPLRRLCAAIVAFCYFWLSTVVACQHTHHIIDDLAASGAMPSRISASSQHAPLKTDFKAAPAVSKAGQCLACEWQASSVSPALPAIFLFLASPCAPRIAADTPRCLSLRAPTGSSRAPPLA